MSRRDWKQFSKAQFESSWKDYPGTYLFNAAREGITLYEMA